MKNVVEIPKHDIVDDKIVSTSSMIFDITYKKNKKTHLGVIVNGYLTSIDINYGNYHETFKKNVLLAISEYMNSFDKTIKYTGELSTLDSIKKKHEKHKFFLDIIKTHLLPISREYDRDKLTSLGLFRFVNKI